MIILINGTFGVGKTTVAELLADALPKSLLYDPEVIGIALRSVLEPVERYDDFQHYPEWRSLTVEIAKIVKQRHGVDLIIPMSIWREEYFTEVVSGLKKIDSDFHHFCLTASIQTVHHRLNERGEQKPGSWAHKQAEYAIPALQSSVFTKHIDAETMSADEINSYILSELKS